MPADVGAELAQRVDGECRGADAVDVVVAVHDDPPPSRDRLLDRVARGGHRSERERIVQRPLEVEERARLGRVVETAPDQHLGRDPRDAERRCEAVDDIARSRA